MLRLKANLGRPLAAAMLVGGALCAGGAGAHAHAQTANPSCSYLFYDATSDAPDNSAGTAGAQQPNLDIVEGDMGLSADGTTLRTVLTLQKQDFSFAKTGPGIDYQLVFAFGTNAQGSPNMFATDAALVSNPSGAPTELFEFGLFQGIGTSKTGQVFTQFVSTANVTGKFTSGPGGQVEVDVPLSDITAGGSAPPKIGDKLTGAQGYSASGQGTEGAGNEFISDTDPSASSGDPAATVGNDYTIGQATCAGAAYTQPATNTPEAPATIGLIIAGIAVIGGFLLYRRRGRSRTVDEEPAP